MVFLVVGPPRGGRGKTPLTTKQKNTLFYDFKKLPEPHETQEKLIIHFRLFPSDERKWFLPTKI